MIPLKSVDTYNNSPELQKPARKKDDLVDQLAAFRKMVTEGRVHTLEPLLPLLLTLKGQPYTLEDHFPFAPLFFLHMPTNTVIKSGRQVSKSTSIAANGIIVANSIPFFNTLYVTPLYEQVRKLSGNYVRPFIEQSPVRSLWTSTSTENSVLQRSFKNNSKMFFSFALLDAERIRGISADKLLIDEAQDMDPSFVPIIKEVMSHSKWALTTYTGTPKSLDNTMEHLWKKSSQAEWFIKCQSCNHWNIPSLEYDVIAMLGEVRDDISEKYPATICAKCQKSISPRHAGRWVHRYSDKNRRFNFAGYHIPQIIMPLHYSSKKKWAELLGKQAGMGNTTKTMFFNEVLGESFDLATKLINETDLKKAACLGWPNKPQDKTFVTKLIGQYPYRCLAVDWGGQNTDKNLSFTTLALIGWKGTGHMEVVWAKRLLTPYDHIGEAKECLQVFNAFKCHFLAHDYTGAGSLRETFINHAGVGIEKIIPIAYCRTASRDLMSLHNASRSHPRDYYLLDKARSLQLVCNSIKLGVIKFFQDDYVDEDNPGLLRDFLALIENKVDTAHAGDLYTIVRNPMFSDDFAQAVNIGCCALWHATNSWPNLAQLAHLQISANQMKIAAPPRDQTWKDSDEL